MAKYAVVQIFCDANGRNRSYSKPDKTFTSIKEARLYAKKRYTPKHGSGWIVQLFNDGAEVLGQVWDHNEIWTFSKYPSGTDFILKADGSLGEEVDWRNPRYARLLKW